MEKPKRESVLQSWILKIKKKVKKYSPTKPIYKLKERTKLQITIIKCKLGLKVANWAQLTPKSMIFHRQLSKLNFELQ